MRPSERPGQQALQRLDGDLAGAAQGVDLAVVLDLAQAFDHPCRRHRRDTGLGEPRVCVDAHRVRLAGPHGFHAVGGFAEQVAGDDVVEVGHLVGGLVAVPAVGEEYACAVGGEEKGAVGAGESGEVADVDERGHQQTLGPEPGEGVGGATAGRSASCSGRGCAHGRMECLVCLAQQLLVGPGEDGRSGQAVEHDEPQLVASGLLVQAHGGEQLVEGGVVRGRQPEEAEDGAVPGQQAVVDAAAAVCDLGDEHHADGDRLAVPQAEAVHALERMPERVAVVERLATDATSRTRLAQIVLRPRPPSPRCPSR